MEISDVTVHTLAADALENIEKTLLKIVIEKMTTLWPAEDPTEKSLEETKDTLSQILLLLTETTETLGAITRKTRR